LGGLAYLKIKKCGLSAYADAVMPYLLVGWAIGRIGCFLNWDSFGGITSVPWATVVYGEARHPTQLYEVFGYLIAFFAIRRLRHAPVPVIKKPGVEAALALGLFALVRFIVDFWRDDPSSYFIASQLMTAAIFVASAVYIFWASKRG
jgi:phosphatidylglycerol:prolipoprotein diacylglycerol transferase